MVYIIRVMTTTYIFKPSDNYDKDCQQVLEAVTWSEESRAGVWQVLSGMCQWVDVGRGQTTRRTNTLYVQYALCQRLLLATLQRHHHGCVSLPDATILDDNGLNTQEQGHSELYRPVNRTTRVDLAMQVAPATPVEPSALLNPVTAVAPSMPVEPSTPVDPAHLCEEWGRRQRLKNHQRSKILYSTVFFTMFAYEAIYITLLSLLVAWCIAGS